MVSILLAISMMATFFAVFRLDISAEDYEEFSSGAVLLDASYSGKNVLIKNGVFSVTVSGATNVNIIFDGVTMDRRYASDTNGTITNLYNVSTALGWGNTAQTSPLLLTNGASATVSFRGVNNFYAGTNGCTVSATDSYTKKQSGGGFAGIQVDSGSTLTIAPSGGTLNVHGGYWVDADNSNNVPNTSLYENDGNGYGWPSGAKTNLSGGAGIGGGAAWNTTTSASQNYTAGTPGTIIINGGNINAHGGHQAAGIGGGLNGAATSDSITINGGRVIAHGGRWAAGIGDGDSLQNDWTTKYKDPYLIQINGGEVDAVGGVNCPGIGTTDEVSAKQTRKDTSGLTIQLNGGEITARSGCPDKFNPNGTAGYTGTDAAAAIGAGNNTNMKSNSIYVSSAAQIVVSGFGHYSATEYGVKHETRPTVNIDSDSYAFLGRFPELASSHERTFELYEAHRFDYAIGDKTYKYVKYVTQPSDGSTGEIYYYSPEAPDNKWLKKAGADGTIENATDVPLDSLSALETEIDKLMLTLYVDFYVDQGQNAPKMENAPEWCRLLDEQVFDQFNHSGAFFLGISEFFRRHAAQSFKICFYRISFDVQYGAAFDDLSCYRIADTLRCNTRINEFICRTFDRRSRYGLADAVHRKAHFRILIAFGKRCKVIYCNVFAERYADIGECSGSSFQYDDIGKLRDLKYNICIAASVIDHGECFFAVLCFFGTFMIEDLQCSVLLFMNDLIRVQGAGKQGNRHRRTVEVLVRKREGCVGSDNVHGGRKRNSHTSAFVLAFVGRISLDSNRNIHIQFYIG